MDISSAVVVLSGATGLSAKFINDFLGYGITLHGIDNKPLWTTKSFPKNIRQIEETAAWKRVTRGYYLDRAKVEWQGWSFVVTLMLLWATWLLLASFSAKLKDIQFLPEITFYEFSQGAVISLVLVWLFMLIRQWYSWGKQVQEICS